MKHLAVVLGCTWVMWVQTHTCAGPGLPTPDCPRPRYVAMECYKTLGLCAAQLSDRRGVYLCLPFGINPNESE